MPGLSLVESAQDPSSPRLQNPCHRTDPSTNTDPSSIIPGGQTGAAALKDLETNLNVMQYTWNTDVVGGTHLTFKIVDKNGDISYSAPITVRSPPALF